MEKQRGTENKFNLRCQEALWQGQEKSSQPVCCTRFRAAGIKFPVEYTSVWKLKGKVPGTRHVWVSVKHGTFGKQFRRQDMASWYFPSSALWCATVQCSGPFCILVTSDTHFSLSLETSAHRLNHLSGVWKSPHV